MQVLWVTSGALPEANELIDGGGAEGGSWLVGMAESMSQADGVSLSIAFPANQTVGNGVLKGSRIDYYRMHARNEAKDFEYIISNVKPDVVHIFGTEHYASLEAVKACAAQGVRSVVSVQGLLSYIVEHYLAGLPSTLVRRSSFRDMVRHDNLIQQRQKLAKRGVRERETLRLADYIIGRTAWDRACIQQIKPDAEYRKCNETLRSSFYSSRWDPAKKQDHRIFVGQGYYPIKGLHWLLRAMPVVLAQFPDAHIVVAGPNPMRGVRWTERLRRSSYDRYLAKLIGRLGLGARVAFVGPLTELEMRDAYLASHVFVLPSSIENSSNSLGEAMILGVPSIASFVGGTPDFIEQGVNGLLYPADAPYMLAHCITRIFSDDAFAWGLSEKARVSASSTFDRAKNCRALLTIYDEVIDAY